MGIKDLLHVVEAVSGDRRDLRHRASCDSQPRHDGSAQVVEGKSLHSGFGATLSPGCPKAVARPFAPPQGRQNGFGKSLARFLIAAFQCVETLPEWCAYRNDDALQLAFSGLAAGLVLGKPDVSAVISFPGQLDQIALTLPRPQCQLESQMKMFRRLGIKGSFLGLAPDEFGSAAAVKPTGPLARVGRDEAAIESPCEYPGEDRKTIVGSAFRRFSDFVAPGQKFATRSSVGQRRNRKIAKFGFDVLEVLAVIFAGSVSKRGIVRRLLECLKYRVQCGDRLLKPGLVCRNISLVKFGSAGVCVDSRATAPCIIVGGKETARQFLAYPVTGSISR